MNCMTGTTIIIFSLFFLIAWLLIGIFSRDWKMANTVIALTLLVVGGVGTFVFLGVTYLPKLLCYLKFSSLAPINLYKLPVSG